MRIRFHCLFVAGMLLLSSAFADEAALPFDRYDRYDHYDPVRLNEFALQKIREGDAGTALILLERASLLAPHDMRIRQNLETVQAWRAGRPAPLAAALSAEPMGQPVQPAAAEEEDLPQFPLWPKR